MSEKKTKNSAGKNAHTPVEKQPLDLVTPIADPTDPKAIPFPEWSDDEVNLASASFVAHAAKTREKQDKSDRIDRGEHSEDSFRGFEDSQVLFLPFCLQEMEYEWKRPREIFKEYQTVIYAESSEYPDLLTDSSHLMLSAFIRGFISSVTILEYLGNTTNFNTEATTAKYVPNATGPWRPWHHIYSGGKVGGGTTHNPQINSSGKYFVRLFWLGTWRKIVIDDFLPVDKTGHVLLPSLPIPRLPPPSASILIQSRSSTGNQAVNIKGKGQKAEKAEKEPDKPVVEIWPFLLSKALLKLANMTMNKDRDLLDFNVIHCLTGWVLLDIDLKGLSVDEIWELCKSYTKIFSWPPPELQEPVDDKKEKKKKKKKKLSKVLSPGIDDSRHCHYLVALCKDMRSLKASAVHGISPCYGHEIAIDECRDLPLEQPPPNPEYPLWKTFRWTEWAKTKGFITDPVELDTTRYVKCTVPFKQFSKYTVHKEVPPEDETKKIEFPLRRSISAALTRKMMASQDSGQSEQKSHRSDTSRSPKSKDKKNAPASIPPDPSIWVKFEELCNHLVKFKIFFKPSEFEYKARVSDLQLNEIMKFDSGGKGKTVSKSNSNETDTWQTIRWSNVIQERKNAPLYFFIDSIQTKMILINLAQAGDVERLIPFEEELDEDNFFVEYERLFGYKDKSDSDKPASPNKLKLNRARIHASLKKSNLLFERCRWDDAETGKVDSFLSTYGHKSTLLELDPGRHIYRVWIKSEFSFCITILADSRFSVGCHEQILDNMSEEPMQITQFTLDISKSFANLLNSFGTPDFPPCLRDYYKSYQPKDANTRLTKQQRCLIHSAFQKSLLRYMSYIQDLFSVQKTIEALRSLFLDVNIYAIRHSSLKTPGLRRENNFQFQSLQEKIICEKASTKLSAFFKGVQMRMLKKRHQVLNQHFPTVSDTLKNMYAEVFSIEKRDECLGTVVRSFFNHPTMEDFLSLYDVSKDFDWDVIVQTYTGCAELTRDFVILCRYNIYCHNQVVFAIHLFCSVTNYVLRVIDNDNGQETYCLTNEVFPRLYVPNTFGYTVIGFAWYPDVKLINWKLAFISSRKTTVHFYIEEFKSILNSSFEHYVPICRDLIGKHSIMIKENTMFVLRFSSSYENLKFNIKMYDTVQNLMVDMVGKGKIILPSILLKYGHTDVIVSSRSRNNKTPIKPKLSAKPSPSEMKKNVDKSAAKKGSFSAKKVKEFGVDIISIHSDVDAVTYSLEIYVVDNSWPLSIKEWEVVKKLKENTYFANKTNDEVVQPIMKESYSRTALKSKDFRKSVLKKVEAIESPWYLLQYAFKTNSQASLTKDKRDEEEVYNLKKSWYAVDPERYHRSLELRRKYLAKYMDPGCECPEEYNFEVTELTTPTESSIKISGNSREKQQTVKTPPKEVEEENVTRTTECPKWLTNVKIPPFDLSPYYELHCPCPLEFKRKYVKTEEDHEADKAERLRIIEECDALMAKRKRDMELWIDEANERRTLVSIWYADCRRASERVMHNYHVSRLNFIDKLRAEKSPAKPEKKDVGKSTRGGKSR